MCACVCGGGGGGGEGERRGRTQGVPHSPIVRYDRDDLKCKYCREGSDGESM